MLGAFIGIGLKVWESSGTYASLYTWCIAAGCIRRRVQIVNRYVSELWKGHVRVGLEVMGFNNNFEWDTWRADSGFLVWCVQKVLTGLWCVRRPKERCL